jgi:hypothetical protein
MASSTLTIRLKTADVVQFLEGGLCLDYVCEENIITNFIPSTGKATGTADKCRPPGSLS